VTGTATLNLQISVPPTDHDDENQRFFRKELGRRKVQIVVPADDHTEYLKNQFDGRLPSNWTVL
jgi:hypothetical protein